MAFTTILHMLLSLTAFANSSYCKVKVINFENESKLYEYAGVGPFNLKTANRWTCKMKIPKPNAEAKKLGAKTVSIDCELGEAGFDTGFIYSPRQGINSTTFNIYDGAKSSTVNVECN